MPVYQCSVPGASVPLYQVLAGVRESDLSPSRCASHLHPANSPPSSQPKITQFFLQGSILHPISGFSFKRKPSHNCSRRLRLLILLEPASFVQSAINMICVMLIFENGNCPTVHTYKCLEICLRAWFWPWRVMRKTVGKCKFEGYQQAWNLHQMEDRQCLLDNVPPELQVPQATNTTSTHSIYTGTTTMP